MCLPSNRYASELRRSPEQASRPRQLNHYGATGACHLSARHGWLRIAQVAAIAAIAAGAAAAIYAERATVSEGAFALRRVQIGWVLTGFGTELVSMVALAELQRGLLRGGGRHTLRSVLATAYSSNAIAVAVPIVGSGIATAYAYRDFRRAGTAPELASTALTIAGVFSGAAFAFVVTAAGALVTGNPAAAVAALAAGVPLAAAVTAIMVALHCPRARDWLIGHLVTALRLCKRLTGRRPLPAARRA